MPSERELIAMAGRLADREHRALLSLPRIGGMNPPRAYIALCEHGLADCTIKGDHEAERWHVTIKPLGIELRDFLRSRATQPESDEK